MSTTQDVNKALVNRYIDEVWHRKRIAVVDDFLATDFRRYLSPLAEPLTLAGQKERLAGFQAAFPDVQLKIERMIAEGDRVAFRSTMRGTHQGDFQGIRPTGRTFTVYLLDEIRIENGRFAEHWGGPDLFDLLKQLGAAFKVS